VRPVGLVVYWTPERVGRVLALRAQGLTISEVAAQASKEFERVLASTTIHDVIKRHRPSATEIEARPQRFSRIGMSLTGRVLGDPAPGRTPWA
jgi:hypothetical protein